MKRKIEYRTTPKEVQAEAKEKDGKKVIFGNIPYNSKSQRMYLGYSDCEFEMLLPSVFNKTLADKADVYANYAHDDLAVLGNTKSGTLQLENRDDGLHFILELGDSDIANRCYDTIKRGDCNGVSFEFLPYDWVEENGIAMLRSAKLIAISLCVINPAYLETSTETIMERGIIEMEKIRRAIETKEIDLLNPETLEQVKKLLEEIKAALSIERQIDKEPETKDSEKANEPKAETPEQPKNDTQTEEVKSKETEPDPEQLKKLEELQKELEKELSSN
jgi:phage prohead protease, HK97 family|nr:MAG TPA: prohead serine protease [Caudoviricetes sp.]